MLSLSSLIEFLMDMLRDDATQADFARDPSGTLAARGLSGVTAQDVRDVQPMLADVGGVRPVAHHDDGGAAHPVHHSAPHGHDVVHAIHSVTHSYEVVRPQVTNVTEEYKTYTSYSEFHTDNSMHVGNGSTVTIGVNNQGGQIDHSTVGGHDVDGSGNTSQTTTEIGSHNENNSQTETGSHNTTEQQNWSDVGNHGGRPETHHGGQPTHGPNPPHGHGPIEHGPVVHDPIVIADPQPAEPGAYHDDQHAHSYSGSAEGLHDSYATHEPTASADLDHHSAVPLGPEHV